MIKKYCLFLVSVSAPAIAAESGRINVLNESNNELTIIHAVPAHTKVAVQLIKISAEERLRKAILVNSKEDVIEAVLAGANVHCDRNGNAPIALAALLRHNQAVVGLLECGAEIDAIYDGLRYNGLTLVDHAVWMSHSICAIIGTLIEKGASYVQDTAGNIRKSYSNA